MSYRRARLHADRQSDLHFFSGFHNQRLQHVEVQLMFLQQFTAQSIEVVDKITDKNR